MSGTFTRLIKLLVSPNYPRVWPGPLSLLYLRLNPTKFGQLVEVKGYQFILPVVVLALLHDLGELQQLPMEVIVIDLFCKQKKE